MGKLLINEHPLQVLPTLAKWIGLNEAIFLQQLHYWLNNPKIGQRADGRKWVRNSVGEWLADNFPFWDERTLRRITSNLKADGLIDTRSDLNRMGIDRTLWYTVNYDQLDELTGPVKRIETKRQRRKMPNGQIDRMEANGQIDRMHADKLTGPITRDYTETTNNNYNENDLLGELLAHFLETSKLPTPRSEITKQTWLDDLADILKFCGDIETAKTIIAKTITALGSNYVIVGPRSIYQAAAAEWAKSQRPVGKQNGDGQRSKSLPSNNDIDDSQKEFIENLKRQGI